MTIKKMIKTIIFDYDGVIVDSFKNCYIAYKEIYKEFGLIYPNSIEEFRKEYGYSYIELFRNKGVEINEYNKKKSGEIFKEENLKLNLRIFEGITDVLETLSKEYTLILLSANYTESIILRLEENNLRKYFKKIIAREKFEEILSKDVEFKKILTDENLSPKEVISIGDRNIDYDKSKAAGLSNIIICEYGWGIDKTKIPKDTLLVKTPLEIIKAVEALKNKK